MQDRSARPDRSAAAQDIGTSTTVFGGGLLSIRAGAWIRAPTRGWRLFGGRVDTRPYAGLAVVRRARGYAPLRGWRSSAGAWIRAPTRRCGGGRVDTRPYEALRRRT